MSFYELWPLRKGRLGRNRGAGSGPKYVHDSTFDKALHQGHKAYIPSFLAASIDFSSHIYLFTTEKKLAPSRSRIAENFCRKTQPWPCKDRARTAGPSATKTLAGALYSLYCLLHHALRLGKPLRCRNECCRTRKEDGRKLLDALSLCKPAIKLVGTFNYLGKCDRQLQMKNTSLVYEKN